MEKENKDYEDFTKELKLIDNNKNTDLLDQLPSYNYNETSIFINNLKTEYDQQKTLNMVLENKNYKNNIDNIKKFTSENSGKIEKQLIELKTVSESLQNIIMKNNKLKTDNEELMKISKSKEYNEIANNMRELKSEKDKIKGFLENMGIISPLNL